MQRVLLNKGALSIWERLALGAAFILVCYGVYAGVTQS